MGKLGEIHEIEGARGINSLQGWRKMMMLILAPKSMEGVEEKLIQPRG
jgi:hypothetical protein